MDADQSSSTALVVHNDDDNKRENSTSASSAVVLDALPYVEPLDPNYEQYAISLIEEELHHVVNEQHQQQQRGDVGQGQGGELGEHPSLKRLLPHGSNFMEGNDVTTQAPDFGGRAPLATAAYAALAERRANGDNNDAAAASAAFSINRPDPMAEGGAVEGMDQATLASNLKTSIATSKIQLEQERIRLINLELHQNLETPARYTAYATQLESHYLNPTMQSVELQRRTVDGINATRMEEQTQSVGKLEGMANKWEMLVDKNRRLGKALEGLEREVSSLKESAVRNGEEGGMMMDVAEASKES